MGLRVLFVDPDQRLLDAYRAVFVAYGFEPSTASDGAECIEALRSRSPDVLVLEPDLPNGWGPRLLECLRDDPSMQGLPVLVLTRRDGALDGFPVRNCYTKPVSMWRLAEEIRAAARRETQ